MNRPYTEGHTTTRRRRSLRLPAYDYSQPGAYFVTVVTHQRRLLFEDVTVRAAVEDAWRNIPEHFAYTSLDAFVVMPNHVHGIIVIMDRVGAQHAAPLREIGVRPGSLGAIVRSFKSASTKAINLLRASPGLPVWQRNYYEHVARSETGLDRVRRYIRDNPVRWDLDPENPTRTPARRRGDS